MSKQISEDEYHDYVNDDIGFCLCCQDFRNDNVEPDAEKYTCEECGQDSVMGTEQALLCGYIDIQ